MKNATIYKDFKFKDMKLKFKNETIYQFNNDNILDEYTIENTINHLKQYISYYKLYIKHMVDFKFEIIDNVYTIKIKYNQDDFVSVKKIELVSFNKNELIYL